MPITDDNAPKVDDSTIIVDSLLVSRYAVDAGVINSDTTSVMSMIN